MAEYLLYGFAQSGNCYKAALYLELAGADWQTRFVDYFNGETRTAEYRRINVMGEAPVLEHGDLRLSQSAVILAYLFFEDELGVSWVQYPNIDRWLGRIRAEPRWRHPYALLPGHPVPARK